MIYKTNGDYNCVFYYEIKLWLCVVCIIVLYNSKVFCNLYLVVIVLFKGVNCFDLH